MITPGPPCCQCVRRSASIRPVRASSTFTSSTTSVPPSTSVGEPEADDRTELAHPDRHQAVGGQLDHAAVFATDLRPGEAARVDEKPLDAPLRRGFPLGHVLLVGRHFGSQTTSAESIGTAQRSVRRARSFDLVEAQPASPRQRPRQARARFIFLDLLLLGLVDDLEEDFVVPDHAELVARALLDRLGALLEVAHLGGERRRCAPRAGRSSPSRASSSLVHVPGAQPAALAEPERVLDQRRSGRRGCRPGSSCLGARTPPGRGSSPSRRGLPRCAAAGCTWRRGRSATASRS